MKDISPVESTPSLLNNIEEVLCSLYEEKISKISPEENIQIKNVMVRYSISYHKDFHKITFFYNLVVRFS